MEAEEPVDFAHCRIIFPEALSSLRDIASNHTTYNTLLIIVSTAAYYVDILILLGGAVCRERPELWPIFCSSILTVFEVMERSVSSSL